MIDVVIVDDHPVVRAGLREILGATGEARVAAEFASAEELLSRLAGLACDLVLLDIRLPGIDGLEALRRIRRLRPGLPVLILSVYAEEQFALRALRAGASGYLTKESAPEELLRALRRVASGGRFLSASFAEKLALSPFGGKTHRLPHERLSDRELQVLCLLAGGIPQAEIARRLRLSPKTVATYRSRIAEKIGLATTAELIAYAIRNGLCEEGKPSSA
ncbi:MAG: response regulator transcription factor [Desulfobacterales bacterium]